MTEETDTLALAMKAIHEKEISDQVSSFRTRYAGLPAKITVAGVALTLMWLDEQTADTKYHYDINTMSDADLRGYLWLEPVYVID